jgi:tetratricopeptide (TPR) repeat protein
VRAAVPGATTAATHVIDSALARYRLGAMAPEDRPYLDLAYTLALARRSAEARRVLAQYRASLGAGEVVPEPATEQLASGTIALVEGRPTEAVAAFRDAHDLPIPSFVFIGCRACATLMLARAYDALRQPDSAVAAYERFLERPDADRFWVLAELAPAHERLFEIYAARGDRNHAALHGAAFLRLWAHADPELQPRIAAVRRSLEALSPDRPVP